MQDKLQEYIREEKFYKDVVEDGSDVIFVVDFDLTIIYHNPSLRQTTGYNSLVGQNFIEFIHPKKKQSVLEAFEISKAHPYNSNIEFKFLCNDDTYKYLEFNSINLKFKDGIHGLILDCRDITQRRNVQVELIQAQKTKEQFLANMSHEIRTPINGIAGMINLLKESETTPNQAKYLNAIKHSADNLQVIINDILDFSIIGSGRLVFEQIGFDLIYQTQSVIASLMLQAKEKGLSIELFSEKYNKKTILIGDPVRLNQILINLINNAIKFTHEGNIKISLSCSESHNDLVNVTFKVADTGIGIPKDKIQTIFETFKQADESITRKFGGTGLGLTICKQLVEMQNGKISVSSKVGFGTTFTFVIPYRFGKKDDLVIKEKDSNTHHSSKKSGSISGMRILLVEDNDINRMYAANVLKKWQCKLDEAENGEIALEKLRKHDYDIILMDIHMPVLDGIETSRSIRSSFSAPKKNIPIIAFTANALKGDKDKYLDAGMNSYISKPFIPNELFELLLQYYKPTVSNTQLAKLTDLSYLRKMSNNDESFVQEMVNSFIEKTPEIIKEMQVASRDNNWRKIGELAHKLKPTLTFMGMDNLKSLVLGIENNAKTTNKDNVQKSVNQLITNINDAIEELATNKI